jgi:lyso-ornithine lipid O-acyltransferase
MSANPVQPRATEAAEPSVIGSPLRAFARLVPYVLLTIVLLPVQAVAVALRLPLAVSLPRWYHRICLALLGVRLEVHGARTQARPALYVCNHSSYLDITIFGALLPASFVAKSEVARWPVYGWLAKLQRSVFIDRERRNTRDHLSAIDARIKAGDSLIVFPEGTSDDGNYLLPFRSSLLAVAELKIDGQYLCVQPVSIAYAKLDGIALGRHLRPHFAWYGAMNLAQHLWRMIGLGALTVIVEFHAPVTLAEFADRKSLTQHCQRAIADGLTRALSGRMERPKRRRRRRAP